MGQNRWVSYIFRYRNNVRCENAGFIKMQKISHKDIDLVRIQIGMKLYKKRGCKCMAYLIYGKNQGKYLTDIYFKPEERDTIMKRVEVPWDNPVGDGISIEDYDGLFFVCDDGEVLTGMWQDYDIDVGDMHFEKDISVAEEEKPSPNNQHIEETEETAISDIASDESHSYAGEEDMEDKETSQPAMDEEMESAYTAAESVDYMQICRDMLDTYPKLPLFVDSQLVECVKIVPLDIGKLAMGNWKLGVNSFLSHGYYHYRYLMLGKVSFDKKERYVIGVPGVFTNKEKYLANMFGFSVFVPVRRTKVLTGNFGYWISEVSSV